MTRVVDNLMANALRYTPVEGHIWMGAFSLDSKIPKWLEENFADKISLWKKDGLLILVKN